VEIWVRFNTGEIVEDFVVLDKVEIEAPISSSDSNSRALILSKYYR